MIGEFFILFHLVILFWVMSPGLGDLAIVIPFTLIASLIGVPIVALAKFIPIQSGYEHGSPLFICTTTYNGNAYVGKVISSGKSAFCDIAVGGKEIPVKDFLVLFGSRL